MGVEILTSTDGRSCFFCNTTKWAFGPIMPEGPEFAVAFLKSLPHDARTLLNSELETALEAFRRKAKQCPECGEWKQVYSLGGIDMDAHPEFADYRKRIKESFGYEWTRRSWCPECWKAWIGERIADLKEHDERLADRRKRPCTEEEWTNEIVE